MSRIKDIRRRSHECIYETVAGGAEAVNSPPHGEETEQLWRQYLIATVANIAVLCCGYCLGWTAPINIKLTSNDISQSPLQRSASTDELAWMGSVLNIGLIFGAMVSGFIASAIGRKWALMSSAVPLFVGWTLATVATDMTYLYAARISCGLAVGLLFTISPVYCAEIATVQCRGALGFFLQCFCSAGFLLVYSLGPYMSYHAVTYVALSLVGLFTILFYFMPESPSYCVLKGRVEDAAQSLMMLRGRSRKGVAAELAMIEADVAASMNNTGTFRDLFCGGNFKAFYISCALMFFQQFSGSNAVLFYMTDIFKASGTDLDPFIATIIVGAVQFVASLLTPLVVDRLGRRPLLLISSGGAAVSLALLGIFFLLSHLGSTLVRQISFLPVLSMVLLIIMSSLGLAPLPWAMLGELLPIEVRAAAAPIATVFGGSLSFVVTKFFPSVAVAVGMHVNFFICCACCVASFLFALLVVPETRGKSFQEIREMLNGKYPVAEMSKPIANNLRQ